MLAQHTQWNIVGARACRAVAKALLCQQLAGLKITAQDVTNSPIAKHKDFADPHCESIPTVPAPGHRSTLKGRQARELTASLQVTRGVRASALSCAVPNAAKLPEDGANYTHPINATVHLLAPENMPT